MNLTQLRSFVLVCELGSLSKAAKRLFTVQSAVSRQIKALEDELETKLFLRQSRGLLLTDKGQQLLVRASHILKEVEETKEQILLDNKSISGQVTIGMPPTVASVLAGYLAERLAVEHPNIQLRFVDAFSTTLDEWLQRREIDIAVLYEHKKHHNHRVYPLLLENLYLITTPENKPETQALTFDQLEHYQMVLPSKNHSLRRLIDQIADDQESPLNITIDADSLTILKELVIRGVAATILPLPSIHREAQNGSLSATQITSPSIQRKLILALPTDRPSSNASLKASEILQLQIEDMLSQGVWSGKSLMRNNQI